MSGVGEGTMGGCQRWVRGPWGVVMGRILGGEDIQGEIPGGRRPPIGAEGPQLAKRACPPRRGRENEGA